MANPVEWDAQGKPIQSPASGGAEWDASGKPIGAATASTPAGLPAGQSLPVDHPPAVQMNSSPLGRDYEHPGIAGGLREVPSDGSDTSGSKVGAALQNFGSHAGHTLLDPIMHPIDTATSAVKYAGNPNVAAAATGGAIYNDFKQNGAGAAIPHLLGDVAGNAISGELTGGLVKRAIPVIGSAGEGIQDLAASNLNRKFPPSMREAARGNNPGRGMLESGIGPTISRGSLANKVSGATEAVGSRIGDVVDRADQNANAPTITPNQIRPSISGPIRQRMAEVNGFGGTGDTEPFSKLNDVLQRPAPGGSGSLYGPNAMETIPPSELWKGIRNLDTNTRFNVNPEIENVNETRRDIRSNLRPVLESQDPTLKPLSRTYGDLRSAGTAIERSQAPFNIPNGLSGLLDSTVNSVPVNTTASSGLFRVGGAMKNLGTNAPEWMGGKGGSPATMTFAQRAPEPTQRLLPADAVGNANYGPRSMANGGYPGRDSISPVAPHSPMALPTESQAGEVQPMIAERAPSHPGVADDFARTRIAPSRAQLNRMGGTTLPPEHEGLLLGNGPTMRALPSSTEAGEAQPMIGIRAPQYPALAEPFARERIAPPQFTQPAEIRNNPFEVAPSGNAYGNPPKGPRELPAPPPPKTKKGKG